MPSRQVDEHAIVWIKPPPGEFRSDPYDKVLTPSRRFGFELNPGKQAGSQREDGHEMADHSGQESRNVLRRYSVKTYQRLIHTPPIWEKTPIPNSQPGVAGTKSSPPERGLSSPRIFILVASCPVLDGRGHPQGSPLRVVWDKFLKTRPERLTPQLSLLLPVSIPSPPKPV